MGTGLKLTKKGWEIAAKVILEAYYNSEMKEEIVKIARALGLDLEALKDDFLTKTLNIEESKQKKLLPIIRCRECSCCDSQTNSCLKTHKAIPDLNVIPEFCPLENAPE